MRTDSPPAPACAAGGSACRLSPTVHVLRWHCCEAGGGRGGEGQGLNSGTFVPPTHPLTGACTAPWRAPPPCSGKPLFPGSGDIDQLCRIVAALGSIREEAWPGVRDLPDWSKLQFPETAPQPLGALLPGCDPAGLELLQGLLQYNPEQRLTAAQALQSGYFSSQPVRAGPAALLAAVESVFPHAMRAQEPCTSCLGTHV